MKTTLILVGVLLYMPVFQAMKPVQTSGIGGRVSPADAVESVWAIQGKDSLKTLPGNGLFMLAVKPGLYKVIIDARTPYKDVLFESVEVNEGRTTDLGEIKLVQ